MNSCLSLVSYNMHGYNQGQNLLEYFWSESEANVDIILLQEHWLTPDGLYKLANFSERYTCFGVSAMEQAVTQSVIRGRSWGGVSTLVKNSIGDISFQHCSERLVIVACGSFLLINTYFPKINSDTDLCVVQSVLAEIEDSIVMHPNLQIIWGGDFNFNFNLDVAKNSLFSHFMLKYKLVSCDSILDANLHYTYCHDSLQHYSLIDFFMISNSMALDLTEFKILDLAYNLSDHCPVYIKLKCNHKYIEKKQPDQSVNAALKNNQKKLRWDHANLSSYSSMCQQLLQPLHTKLCSDYAYLMAVESSVIHVNSAEY